MAFTSHHITSHHITSHHITSHHITPASLSTACIILLSGCAANPCCTPPQQAASVYQQPVAAPQPQCSAPSQPQCVASVQAQYAAPIAQAHPVSQAPYVGPGSLSAVGSPAKLQAVGYGALGSYQQYTAGQQKLMAIRAAELDAYRKLAEQVQGFRVWGNTAVSAFAAQNDAIRSYVDAFIRGARVVSTTAIADGNFEVTVELDIPLSFLNCFAPGGICGTKVMAPVCAVPGCGAVGM